MKTKRIVLSMTVAGLVLSSLALTPQQQSRDIQALLVKVVRDVRKKSPTRAWEKAVPADRLRSGYQLRTDAKSLAMIVFPDRSKLIVRQRSIVEIKGQTEEGQIVDRSVHVERGRLQFNVQKQQREQFRFSSPISVASIRGTAGGVDHDATDTTSIFVCTEGLFDVDGNTLIAGQTYEKKGNQPGQVRQSTETDDNIGSEDTTRDEEEAEEEDQQQQDQQGQQQQGQQQTGQQQTGQQQTGQQQKPKLELVGRDASGKEVKVVIE